MKLFLANIIFERKRTWCKIKVIQGILRKVLKQKTYLQNNSNKLSLDKFLSNNESFLLLEAHSFITNNITHQIFEYLMHKNYFYFKNSICVIVYSQTSVLTIKFTISNEIFCHAFSSKIEFFCLTYTHITIFTPAVIT